MTSPVLNMTDNRIQGARAFAAQFTPFEWKYLCSREWFITAVDRAMENGDFLQIEKQSTRCSRRCEVTPVCLPRMAPILN
jgi:hypothetical protein